ncbi:LysR family transcriptional regulator [Actinomycetes bacterium KLBMP 9759]
MSHSFTDGSIDLGLFRTFLAVHRSGSFTAAARLLGLSQPAVTGQMRALERQLGRPLFERLPRGVASTPVADALAVEVAGPLDALAAVAERGHPAVAHRPVHLGGPSEWISMRVLPALAPLVARGVRLRVTTGLADDLLERLRAGTLDLVFSSIRPRGRTVIATPVMDEEFVLVAAPVWAERIGPVDVDRPGVLRDVPLLTYAEDLPIARRYWRHVFGARLAAQAAVVVPDLRGLLSAAVAGAGITVLPTYLCAPELASGALVRLLDPADPPINTGYLAERAGARGGTQLAEVRDEVLRAARDW